MSPPHIISQTQEHHEGDSSILDLKLAVALKKSTNAAHKWKAIFDFKKAKEKEQDVVSFPRKMEAFVPAHHRKGKLVRSHVRKLQRGSPSTKKQKLSHAETPLSERNQKYISQKAMAGMLDEEKATALLINDILSKERQMAARGL